MSWDKQILELEEFFKTATLPEGSIELSPGITIIDIPKFIDTHLQTSKAHNGKKTFLPYIERLIQLKKLLIKQSNA